MVSPYSGYVTPFLYFVPTEWIYRYQPVLDFVISSWLLNLICLLCECKQYVVTRSFVLVKNMARATLEIYAGEMKTNLTIRILIPSKLWLVKNEALYFWNVMILYKRCWPFKSFHLKLLQWINNSLRITHSSILILGLNNDMTRNKEMKGKKLTE